MKLPFRPPKKKKLQAATVRRTRDADYTDEPNVKLSSAFIVVLLIHVVAVVGVIAFTALNPRPAAPADEAEAAPQQQAAQAQAAAAPAVAAAAEPAAAPVSAPAPAQMITYRVRSGDTILRIANAYNVSAEQVIDLNDIREEGGIHVGEELKLPAGAAAVQTSSSHTGTYTVVHGDTLRSIARRLHVSSEELMRINKIDDPRRLRIGLKLKIPPRHSASSETT
jgi:LysM repeat protein